MHWLFDIDDNRVGPATPGQVYASEAAFRGVFWIDGKEYYTEYSDDDDGDDNWRQEWRQEIAREEGMLGGCNAYNDWMGY